MNRNNGRAISERLVILRDYLFTNADRTHAVSMEDIQKEYYKAGIESEDGKKISIKTVYRDLEAIEDIWKIRTKYVEKYKGYVLLNPPFEANEMRLIRRGIPSLPVSAHQWALKHQDDARYSGNVRDTS